MQFVQVDSSSLTSSCSDQVTLSTGDLLVNASIENDMSSTMNPSLPTQENQELRVSIQTNLNDHTNVVPDQRTKSQRRKDRRFREKQQGEIQALQRQHLKELDPLRQRQVKEQQGEIQALQRQHLKELDPLRQRQVKEQQGEIQALQRQHLKELDQLRQRQVKEQQQRLKQRERYWIDQQQKKNRQQTHDTFGVRGVSAEQIHTTTNNTITPLRDIDGFVVPLAPMRMLSRLVFKQVNNTNIKPKMFHNIYPTQYRHSWSDYEDERDLPDGLDEWQQEDLLEAYIDEKTPAKEKWEQRTLWELQQETEIEIVMITEGDEEQLDNIKLASKIIKEEHDERDTALLISYERNEQIDFLLQQSNEPHS